MNKLKHFLPKHTLKIMYSSLIAPHFNNNILLWAFNTHRLIKLQNRAIRIITDSKYNSHTEPLLKSLNILKINYIFTIQCLKFFHNYKNDRVPVFFRSFFVENALYHYYETRHCHHICIPHSHTTKARKCIRSSSSFVSFTQCSPTCGRMPLPAQSLWPVRRPYRPRLVGGRRGGVPSSVAPRSRNPPTGRRRDSHTSPSLFLHGPPLCAVG